MGFSHHITLILKAHFAHDSSTIISFEYLCDVMREAHKIKDVIWKLDASSSSHSIRY
jgi:hypothetical protein